MMKPISLFILPLIGLLLAILSIPIDAYILLGLLTILPLEGTQSLYFSWMLSSAVSAILILVPSGYILNNFPPFRIGAITGLYAVVVLVVINLMNNIPLSLGFCLEYLALIIFSILASYIGKYLKKCTLRIKMDGS